MMRLIGWWTDLRLRNAVVLGVGILLVLVATCAVFVHFSENWDWIDAIYFAVVSLATVGYGDLVPTNDATKIFIIFYMPVGISLWFVALGTIGAKILELQRRSLEVRRAAATAALRARDEGARR